MSVDGCLEEMLLHTNDAGPHNRRVAHPMPYGLQCSSMGYETIDKFYCQ